MLLKIKVKVSHISSLSDARYCAGMGVNWLGFSSDETKEGFVSPTTFKEITEWISGPDFIIEISEKDIDGIEQIITEYHPGAIQLQWPIRQHILDRCTVPIIISLSFNQLTENENELKEIASQVEYFSVEKGTVDWQKLTDISSKLPVYIGTDVSPNTIPTILASPLSGITLYGSVEDKPGFKDYDELAGILELLEED